MYWNTHIIAFLLLTFSNTGLLFGQNTSGVFNDDADQKKNTLIKLDIGSAIVGNPSIQVEQKIASHVSVLGSGGMILGYYRDSYWNDRLTHLSGDSINVKSGHSLSLAGRYYPRSQSPFGLFTDFGLQRNKIKDSQGSDWNSHMLYQMYGYQYSGWGGKVSLSFALGVGLQFTQRLENASDQAKMTFGVPFSITIGYVI